METIDNSMINKKIYPLFAVIVLAIGFSVNYSYAAEMDAQAQLSASSAKAIPDWVKTNFDWYLKGNIDEATLLTSMNWMFDNNIMHLSQKAAQEVNELRAENQKLHEQLGHELTHTQQQGSDTAPSTDPDKSGRVKIQFPWLPDSSCIIDISKEPGQEALILALDPTDLEDSDLQELEKRDYCVQHNETDLDFVTRLAKRQGFAIYLEDDSMMTKPQITTPQIVIPSTTAGEMATKELMQQYENAEAKTIDITNKIKSNIEEKTNLKERITKIRQQIDTTYDRATKITFEKEIAMLESKIATLDDMTQMMQLELQDAMEKQQQAFTMISNIMKSFHDTAKSVINNIK
jgi:hypothetical protein